MKFQFVRKIHGAKQTGQPPFHRLSNYPWKENFLSSGARRTSRKSITRLSQPRGNIWSGSAARIGSRRFRYRNSRHVNPITKDSFQARWESETISQRWYRDERKQTEKREGDKERERERERTRRLSTPLSISMFRIRRFAPDAVAPCRWIVIKLVCFTLVVSSGWISVTKVCRHRDHVFNRNSLSLSLSLSLSPFQREGSVDVCVNGGKCARPRQESDAERWKPRAAYPI